MARDKSILTEAKQIERAVTLIHLGARLQVLESETDLSLRAPAAPVQGSARQVAEQGPAAVLDRLVHDLAAEHPRSLFLNIHEYLNKVAELDEIDTVIKAYQLYLEQTQAQGLEPLLSVTRAWRLVKFVDNGMLTMTKCSKCGGHFVTPPARDRQALRLRPVQPAGACRQGQGRRRDPACSQCQSPTSHAAAAKSASGQLSEARHVRCVLACLLLHI